jgi:hypothetical protein
VITLRACEVEFVLSNQKFFSPEYGGRIALQRQQRRFTAMRKVGHSPTGRLDSFAMVGEWPLILAIASVLSMASTPARDLLRSWLVLL